MNSTLSGVLVVLFIVGWLLLSLVILPKMGVPT
jgi:uncharacterized membrane protein (Fun14 family)